LSPPKETVGTIVPCKIGTNLRCFLLWNSL